MSDAWDIYGCFVQSTSLTIQHMLLVNACLLCYGVGQPHCLQEEGTLFAIKQPGAMTLATRNTGMRQ